MEFDVTNLDKNLLLKALFAHSAPLNLAKAEFFLRKEGKENVDGLTDEECEMILFEFHHLDIGSIRILDYYKGKPMKLVFNKNKNGRVLVDSCHYDAHNGKYRFLEAMLETFLLDEIQITKKGYRKNIITDIPDHLTRSQEQETMFKNIIKNTVQKVDENGKYWSIGENSASYVPPFLESFISKIK